MERISAAWIVRGRVQGVGFRYFVLATARALGVCGWVRNLRDGSVEVQAVGEPGAVRRLEAALREGPGHARVDELVGVPPSGNLEKAEEFTIEY